MEVHYFPVITVEIAIDLATIIVSGYLIVKLYRLYQKFKFDVILHFIFGFILLSSISLSELLGFFTVEESLAKLFFKLVGIFAVLAEFNYAAILSKILRGNFDIKVALTTGFLTYFVIFDIIVYDIQIFKSGYLWDYTQYCSLYCNLVVGGFIIVLAIYQLKIITKFLHITRDFRRKIINRGYTGSLFGVMLIGVAFVIEPLIHTTYLMYLGGLGVFIFVASFAYILIREPHIIFLVPYRIKAVILYNKKGFPIIGEYYENFLDAKATSILIKTINMILEHESTTKKSLVKYISLTNDTLIFHATNNLVGFILVEKYHPYIELLFKKTMHEIKQMLDREKLDPSAVTQELVQKIQKILSERISHYTFAPIV